MAFRHKCLFAFVSVLFLQVATSQYFNPTILQDSRDLPKVDGTFGFLYRTEDGIAHAAKGDANGVIHGRFSYTDPTGLKVNYNYNAGSRVAPGYDDGSYDNGQYQQPKTQQQKQPQPQPQQKQPARQEHRERQQYDYEDDSQYQDPEPEYVPRTRPSVRSQSQPSPRRQSNAQYREPVQDYSSGRARPQYSAHNEVYDDYSN